jgi:hypothetical protein
MDYASAVSQSRLRPSRRPLSVVVAAFLVLVLAACGGQQTESRTLQLETLNDSGVTGTAVLTDNGDGTTRVAVEVDAAGHPDMPAHIHPGTCTNLTPQPRYPLQNAIDGVSETDIDVPLEELFAGGLALNLHASPDDFETYTACAELI